MGDLTANDVTLSIAKRDKTYAGYLHLNLVTLAVGDGSKLYPAAGYIPLPTTPSKYGVHQKIHQLSIAEPPIDGLIYKIDRTNMRLYIYQTAAYSGAASLLPFSFADAKGATALAGTEASADQASDVVNAGLLSNYALVSSLVAGALVMALSPDVPRNVQITVKNDSGGPLNLYQGTTSIAVVGTFRGAAQSETISWVSTSGNKAIADGKFRAISGVKPFDTVTSITVTNLPDATLKIAAGVGSKVGLPVDPLNNLESDLKKAMLSAADYSITGNYNTTNKTLACGTTADGWDLLLEYNIAGSSAAAPLAALGNVALVAKTMLLQVLGK